MTVRHRFHRHLAIAAAIAVAACEDGSTATSLVEPTSDAVLATLPTVAQYNQTLAELRRVTAKYHDVAVAVAEGFVPVLSSCDAGESNVIPYAHIPRLLDGVLDPSLPDALLYEARGAARNLVGVEMVMPYPLWTAPQDPSFLGVTLQREDDLGVFGLHVWVWRHNPNGMFAIINPNITCEL